MTPIDLETAAMSMPWCVLLAVLLSGAALADDGDLVSSFGEDGVARLGIVDAYGTATPNPVVDAG